MNVNNVRWNNSTPWWHFHSSETWKFENVNPLVELSYISHSKPWVIIIIFSSMLYIQRLFCIVLYGWQTFIVCIIMDLYLYFIMLEITLLIFYCIFICSILLGFFWVSRWLGIKIMCQSGATCQSMDCCFSELV